MLTDRKPKKLSHEILLLIGIAAGISFLLFLILTGIATAVAEGYYFDNDIPMTELDWIPVDRLIFGVGVALACSCFAVLFLFLLHDRIAYIRTITDGIGQLHAGQKKLDLPLQGSNELTELADAINTMSEAQLALHEKELALQQEKEDLIRTLSHDIRTPLTSILAYSEYLSITEEISPNEQRAYLQLIEKKAQQIRDMTAILLDGGRRDPEVFEDARLLMEQLAAEFEEILEDQFQIETDLSVCPAFSGSFDAQELRRIFDNLSSHVQKYADPATPVILSISIENGSLLIRQSNGILQPRPQTESFRIGLNSIRRIVQHYSGQVAVSETKEQFSATISIPINL